MSRPTVYITIYTQNDFSTYSSYKVKKKFKVKCHTPKITQLGVENVPEFSFPLTLQVLNY